MENGPFSTPEFQRFAKSVVLLCHVTTLIPGEPHGQLLAETCGDQAGNPSVAYIDADGGVIAVHKGEYEVAAFERFSEQSERFLRLQKIQAPNLDQRASLLRAELELDRLSEEQIAQRRSQLEGLEEEPARKLDGAITDWRVIKLWIERQPRTPEQRAALGSDYWDLFSSGQRPVSQRALEAFYVLILDHAEAANKPHRFRAALDALREEVGDVAGMKPYLEQQEQRLRRLR